MNSTNTISFKSNDSSSNKKHNRILSAAVIAGTAGIGAIIGGRYAVKHLSDDATKEISEIKPTLTDYYKRLLSCFDLKKADEHLKSNNITRGLYENITKTIQNIKNVVEKEAEIIKTPIKEQAKSVKKTLNEAHSKFKKSFAFIKKSKIMQDLDKKGIFNSTNYKNLLEEGKKKAKEIMSIISKPMYKGIGIGAGIGILAGIGINLFIKYGTNKEN